MRSRWLRGLGLQGWMPLSLAQTMGSSVIGPPTLTGLPSPSSAPQGATGFTVTLTGTNFIPNFTTITIGGSGVTAVSPVVTSPTSMTATFSVAAGAAATTYPITVTTASGTSNAINFTVGWAVPTLSHIVPPNGAAGMAYDVTLHGTYFVAGSTTVTSPYPGSLAITLVTVTSPTTITARFTLHLDATNGWVWPITVTTPGGPSNPVNFPAVPILPGLLTMSVTGFNPATSVPITVTGSGFIGGGTTVNRSHGDFTVDSVVVTSSTTLTCTITTSLSPLAGSTSRGISVTTAGGTSGTLGFNIVYGAPTLGAVDPNYSWQGTPRAVTLTGTFFVGGQTTVTVSGGMSASGVTVTSPTSLTCTITIPPSTAPATWHTVWVTTPGGTSGAFVGFYVYHAQPTLSDIDPESGTQGSTVTVNFYGSYFVTGMTVGVSHPASISVSGVTVHHAGHMSCSLALAPYPATSGPMTVWVNTPGGSSGALGFTITSVVISWAGPTSGSHPLASGPLTLTAIGAYSVSINATTPLALRGCGGGAGGACGRGPGGRGGGGGACNVAGYPFTMVVGVTYYVVVGGGGIGSISSGGADTPGTDGGHSGLHDGVWQLLLYGGTGERTGGTVGAGAGIQGGDGAPGMTDTYVTGAAGNHYGGTGGGGAGGGSGDSGECNPGGAGGAGGNGGAGGERWVGAPAANGESASGQGGIAGNLGAEACGGGLGSGGGGGGGGVYTTAQAPSTVWSFGGGGGGGGGTNDSQGGNGAQGFMDFRL